MPRREKYEGEFEAALKEAFDAFKLSSKSAQGRELVLAKDFVRKVKKFNDGSGWDLEPGEKF